MTSEHIKRERLIELSKTLPVGDQEEAEHLRFCESCQQRLVAMITERYNGEHRNKEASLS